ncbi:urease accessory protein UreD [Bradyrhizobium sp. LHD-71]|uniref:urease accessory protein UreD n=1 Tax=Bradyrhizobium sp. LHD-71 TaxID=3072141 RepID=UPI00280EAF39|nr:urease accessory protein UreD [Bradyrhizobium sp. LHD-71]MDQ8727026.1 urease accessory protein UreD [Bradyrhizobium sp. LHD-71]
MPLASQDTTQASELFAANRAVGAVTFETILSGGTTRRGRVHEAGSLRVRFPSPETDGLSAVLVNTAGGIAGGDRFTVTIDANAATAVTLTTAAAEKVYRSHGPAAEVGVSLSVQTGARLAWLPQETILFDRARLSRRIDIDLHDDASLLLAEIVVFGRAAMAETMRDGVYRDRWRLRRDGRLIFAETVQLEGDIGVKLAHPAIGGGTVAVATVLIAPADQSVADRVHELAATFAGEVGISAWNGFALARFCAKDAADLRGDVMRLLAQVNASALPRLWLT